MSLRLPQQVRLEPDLANIINEAARSLRSDPEGAWFSQADLIGAVELVFAGKEKKGKLLGDQKKVVAYHEVGHALLVALQKHTEPVQRITIVPRTMGSLGYVERQVPEEEKYMEHQG